MGTAVKKKRGEFDPQARTRVAVQLMVKDENLTIYAAAGQAHVSPTSVSTLLRRNNALITCPGCSRPAPVGLLNTKVLAKLGINKADYISALKAVAGVGNGHPKRSCK